MDNFNLDDIPSYLFDAAITLILLLLIILGLVLVDYLAKRLKKRLLMLHLKSLKIFNLEIINKGKQELIITSVINVLQFFVSISFLYFSLVVILSQIPATVDISKQLVYLIFTPLQLFFSGFLSYLPDLFKIIVSIYIAQYLIGAVKYITNGVIKGNFHFPGFEPRTARRTGEITTFLLYVLTIIIIFPSLPGYESLAFKGIATFLGALITIGGSSVIANYMAGIVITYMHAFDKGDWVEIDGITGKVIAMGAFAIRIQSYKKETINIPNSKVLGSAIRNYSGKNKQDMIVYTEVSISYDVPWKKVNDLLIESAHRTDLLDKEKAPFVHQKKLDDFYIVYELNAYLKEAGSKPKAYSTLHAHILDVFNEAGIEIMSPHYRAERDGSGSTITK